jgi:hypothetical protein
MATKKKTNNGGGRKPAHFDYEKIKKLAGQGLNKEEIALACGYKARSFYTHKKNDSKIEEAILEGRASFKVFLSSTLIEQAKKGNVTAAIWLDKTRCGTREEQANDENQYVQPVKVTIEVHSAKRQGASQ